MNLSLAVPMEPIWQGAMCVESGMGLASHDAIPVDALVVPSAGLFQRAFVTRKSRRCHDGAGLL